MIRSSRSDEAPNDNGGRGPPYPGYVVRVQTIITAGFVFASGRDRIAFRARVLSSPTRT